MGGRRILALVLVLAVAAVAFGCGQSEEATSFETYINDMRPHMERLTDEAIPAILKMNDMPEDATTEDVAALTEEVAATFTAFADGMRSIEPYPDMSAEHAGFASALDQGAAALGEMADVLRHMESADHTQAELEAHLEELTELGGSLDAMDPQLDAFDDAITRISGELGVDEPEWWSQLIEEWETVGS